VTARPTLRLASGGARLAIDVERGGRIVSWSVDGRELLVGPPTPDDRSIRWGCFLMAPWAGRLADGRFRAADGQLGQVARSHGRHAIHGLLWDSAWTVVDAGPDSAILAVEIPANAWPPGGTVRHEVRLDATRLKLVATVTAASPGSSGLLAAVGWHPWFRRDGEVSLRVDADAVLETEAMIPTGRTAPVEGRTDLRNGPRLGRRRLDHAYLDARSPAVVRREDLELTIEFAPSPATVVVHTPASSVCVEPQTAWPNAPALAGAARERSGLRVLRPAESLSASMSMTVRRFG
jgi:aldose 1-epimerase